MSYSDKPRQFIYVAYKSRLYQLPRTTFAALRVAIDDGEDPMEVLADARNEYPIEWWVGEGGLVKS